jgi:hemoglobin/transferrin/lactoferrin receptor protein
MKYNYKKLQNEIYIHYNGWKYAHDFSPAGEDKPSEATRHGYPAWSTVNYRINYSVTSAFNIQFAIENIFDAYYKPYASAVSGPGRNFMVSLLARF